MSRPLRRGAAVALWLLAAPFAGAQGPPEAVLPPYAVQDAAAVPVTYENLLESERFWPYRVALTRPWQPPGAARPLPVGSVGVLIRVESDGKLRADFGRDGLHQVPPDATDILAAANQIRLGEAEKTGPNFAVSLLPRLASPRTIPTRPWSVLESIGLKAYLAIYADPTSGAFAKLAETLAPLRERPNLLTILFPQGAHAEDDVSKRLQELGWRSPFVVDHLSELYTETLIPPGAKLPWFALYSPDGRLLVEGPWSSDALAQLGPAVDTALGPASASFAGASSTAAGTEDAPPAPPGSSPPAERTPEDANESGATVESGATP